MLTGMPDLSPAGSILNVLELLDLSLELSDELLDTPSDTLLDTPSDTLLDTPSDPLLDTPSAMSIRSGLI